MKVEINRKLTTNVHDKNRPFGSVVKSTSSLQVGAKKGQGEKSFNHSGKNTQVQVQHHETYIPAWNVQNQWKLSSVENLRDGKCV